MKNPEMNLPSRSVLGVGVLALLAATACRPQKTTENMEQEPTLKKTEVVIADGKFTPEALWALGRLGEYAVSPDGKTLAYTATWYDMEQNKGWTDLFVMPVSGGQAQQLTHFFKQCYNVVWEADGTLLFVSNHEGSAQIYRMQADGSNLQKCSNVEGDVEGFKLSPKGDMVLYTKSVKMIPQASDRYPDLDKTTGKIYDDLMYRHWDSWDEGERSHIFFASFAGGTVGAGTDIMEGEPFDSPLKPFGGMEEIAWNADGSAIAYTCLKLQGKEAAFSTNSDVYLYTLDTKQTVNLTAPNPGYDRCPTYSPDGQYMAWLSMPRAGFEADKERLMLLSLKDGQIRHLTENFDYNPSGLCWRADSKALYFTAGVKGTTQIYSLGLEEAAPTALTSGVHDYHSVALAGEELVGDRVSMLSPAEVYRISLADGTQQKITEINDALLAKVNMPTVRELYMTATDGKPLQSWLILPPNFDSTKQYPCLLFCEGGPQSPLTQFWSYRWNFAVMASQGYIVLAPNRRGTTTFGQEWTDAISKDHGGQEMRDLLLAIDNVAKEPWVDANRLGAVGASYGGYTVNWLAGNHSKRFKAFISHCGIFHSEMEYYTTEEMFFDEWEMGGAPWDKANRVAQASFSHSPHEYVANWDTPIMIIHGGRDFRIPYTQGMAAFDAARMRGVEARFLFFPDESHWVLKPQNGLLWQREFFRWLDTYLKPPADK